MRMLTLPQRLVVAADFKPDPTKDPRVAREEARYSVLNLADSLQGLGVWIKVNAVLRAVGYTLIEDLLARGVRVFGDLKLKDIKETLANDGAFLLGTNLGLLTAMCDAGEEGLKALQGAVPETKVLGVTFLTSLTDADAKRIHGCDTAMEAVLQLAGIAKDAGLAGVVASAKEAAALREKVFGDSMLIVTPAIRPASLLVAGDDQNPERIMTPTKAIRAGADILVVGRPIVQAKDPRDAVLRTLDEIASAL